MRVCLECPVLVSPPRLRCRPCAAERNRQLTRLRYQLERGLVLRKKRRYYRQHRDRIRSRQAEYRIRHPFVNTPVRRKYMRIYMQQWRARA